MGPRLLDRLQPHWLREHTALVVKKKNGSWHTAQRVLVERPLEREYGLLVRWHEQTARPEPGPGGAPRATSHPLRPEQREQQMLSQQRRHPRGEAARARR